MISSEIQPKELWVKMTLLPEVGSIRLRRLLDAFGSPAGVLEASAEDLASVEGITPRLAARIVARRAAADGREELSRAREFGATVLTPDEDDYPALLRTIHDPPPVLYVHGELRPDDGLAVAIVGRRQASPYGLAVADRLARQLAGLGVTVVSGLARGIDAAAHRAALDAGGRTVAVLGNGLGVQYPPEHAALRTAIAKRGAVVSEFPMRETPEPGHFPQRNRVISGLSLGVVVVEADERSGALITARAALEQGREVFAVPGNILGNTSRGPHQLLREGATLVESAEDIVREIQALASWVKSRPEPVAAETAAPAPGTEAAIYDALGGSPELADDLAARVGIPAAIMAPALLSLELKGLIRRTSGPRYLKVA